MPGFSSSPSPPFSTRCPSQWRRRLRPARTSSSSSAMISATATSPATATRTSRPRTSTAWLQAASATPPATPPRRSARRRASASSLAAARTAPASMIGSHPQTRKPGARTPANRCTSKPTRSASRNSSSGQVTRPASLASGTAMRCSIPPPRRSPETLDLITGLRPRTTPPPRMRTRATSCATASLSARSRDIAASSPPMRRSAG